MEKLLIDRHNLKTAIKESKYQQIDFKAYVYDDDDPCNTTTYKFRSIASKRDFLRKNGDLTCFAIDTIIESLRDGCWWFLIQNGED